MLRSTSGATHCEPDLPGLVVYFLVAGLAFRFVQENPYVLASGAPAIMYDSDCIGLDWNRFYRFVRVHEWDSPVPTKDGNAWTTLCFDDVLV